MCIEYNALRHISDVRYEQIMKVLDKKKRLGSGDAHL